MGGTYHLPMGPATGDDEGTDNGILLPLLIALTTGAVASTLALQPL